MHLLESLASFLAASTVTNTSSSSNLPKPLSRFLAAGSGAYGPPMWERVGEVTNNVHNGAATYGPPMLEKLGEVTDNVRNGAAAYGPPMLERLGEVANNVRHGAAAPVWEKMEEATHNVHNHAAVYGPPMLEKLGEVANSVRNGAAAYGQPVWEKAEVIRNDAQWSAANPVPAACAVVGAGGVIAVAAPGIVSALILSSAGFGATGVQAGSAAAAIHSTIGNVGANSLFGLFQSAGASASGLAVVNGVIQVGGAVAVSASGGVAWVKSML